jgi:hypothetical protein
VQSPAKSNQRPYNLLFHVKHASLKSMSTEWLAQSQLNVSGRNNVSTCWLFTNPYRDPIRRKWLGSHKLYCWSSLFKIYFYHVLFFCVYLSMSTEWLAQSQLNVSGRNNVSTCWLFLQLIILWKSNCTLVWYKEAQWVLVEQYVYMQTVLSVHILLFKTKKETQFKQLTRYTDLHDTMWWLEQITFV